jgi:uncharacterized damage-inducible protein DinB
MDVYMKRSKMITRQELAAAFAFNLRGAKELTIGLNHADSVLQPPARGNCLNWVLGHMLDTRNDVLKLLGQSGFLTEAQAKRYGYGSQPVCEDGGDILKLETAMALLEKSQSAIEAALGAASEETLAKEHKSFMGTTTLAFFLLIMYRHESYHLGQAELLRELAIDSHGAK